MIARVRAGGDVSYASFVGAAGPGHWNDADMLPIGIVNPFPGDSFCSKVLYTIKIRCKQVKVLCTIKKAATTSFVQSDENVYCKNELPKGPLGAPALVQLH